MTLRCSWVPLLVLLFVPVPATACTIPVFRFALESWPPSPYELIIFHRGPLTNDQQLVVRQLEDVTPVPNVALNRVDLAGKVSDALMQVWAQQNAEDNLPWVVLRYPDADAKTPDAWAGPLDPSRLAECFGSPGRKAVFERIGRGDSAVFVLLESGNEATDRAALELLRTELARLEKTVTIPEQDPAVSPLQSELVLKVSFPVVRLSRTDPPEKPFVRMLLHSEPDLNKVTGPIAFPIFGRGRLLCALHGEDLNAERLGDVARFLCAACSCRVKKLNPGVDLLMAADWDEMLSHPVETNTDRPPDLPASGVSGQLSLADLPSSRTWLWGGIGAAAVLVVATGAWALSSLRRKPENP